MNIVWMYMYLFALLLRYNITIGILHGYYLLSVALNSYRKQREFRYSVTVYINII